MTRFMYIDKTIDRFVPFVLLADRSMRAGQKGKKGRKAKVHKSFPFIHSAHHCFHLTWRSVLRLLTTLLDQQQGSYSICQRIFNFFGYFSNQRIEYNTTITITPLQTKQRSLEISRGREISHSGKKGAIHQCLGIILN
jgi:hypothetical protein